MIDRVATFIKKRKLIQRSDKVLVAVSGGVDSMVLLHVLKELDYDISVAHMNFQLRGDASDQDETFVRDRCAHLKVSFASKKVDIESEKRENGLSTQMAARKLRYDWFDELCHENGFTKIATAHHLNDSFETMLLNLVKGTGIKGLSGIPATNDKVVRPLLDNAKEDLTKYAKDEGIIWREDSSNADSKYQRNLIRNEVIPFLEKINPSLIETFKSTSDRVIGANAVVENVVDQLRKEHWNESEGELSLTWFDGSEGHVLLLSELLRPYKVSYTLACEIGEEHSSGKIFLTSTHKVVYDRERLLFRQTESESIKPIEILEAKGTHKWGDWKIIMGLVDRDDIQFGSEREGYFDEGQISFPLKVRSWKEGDLFIPLGMKGKKKISDFLIDQKIPLISKEGIPILESKGEIIWIGGFRLDDRFKVQNNSIRAVKIEIEKL